ncbi:Enamine/imine deaminase [Legionella massiliensis]|uniref:Enamine/imine deaminase n=1 Tax=Legionella massiliensis TaxID=1034943 RepID=A0A078L0U4_9GAMM|nr:RidA family protein [Legionella massiliensis]CDZ77663.1 Enamine/imine deaminase [Legionella massiliensis]CEE13401.1 Enamine/imine deaminase [Legionella massiliensis]
MQPIHTDLAPAAIGTYSQAVRCDNTVYLSGQIPLDPTTMQLCSDEIRMQINQVFDNLSAVCEAAGGSLAHLVKINVYLIDLNHFPLVNEAMTRYFAEPYPARAAIGVSALPRAAQVEVDGIMVLNTKSNG